MNNLPQLYHKHLKSQLKFNLWIILKILIALIQEHRWIRLETLANQIPKYTLFESRRRAMQRFLSLRQMKFETLWFPILQEWIKSNFEENEILYLAIDRTQWSVVNLLVISLIYKRRSLPIYITNLEKKGNSNFSEQRGALSKALALFPGYKKVVLGDREFCSMELAKWLTEQEKTYFSLRLKKSLYVEVEKNLWITLKELGIKPGISIYLRGIKVTKTHGFGESSVVAKWKRKYRGWSPEEAWFILTNLTELESALLAYQKRMGIEEMFRDFKTGGYNLEGTQVRGERLISLTLLITFAYSQSIIVGEKICRKGVANYINRPTEPPRKYRRHSHFYTGNRGQAWLNSLEIFEEEAQELMANCPKHRLNYQKGKRAARLVKSAF